jgi:hypothetical protein
MNETTNGGGRGLIRAFYLAVVVVSLIGAAQGAESWLRWPLLGAVAAVLVVELGGMVLAHHASERRKLGETATAARVLSGLIAVAAVALQIYGHKNEPGQAGFFALTSAVGYLAYLIASEAERRDALRRLGLLAEVPPSYGLLQWLREPAITRRARVLAQERAAVRLDLTRRRDAGEDVEVPARLDALASLAAARKEARDTERQQAIARVLRRKIRKAVDRDTADIAVSVYDLDAIAARLTDRADYNALTDLVGADLAPARLTGTRRAEAADTEPVAVPVRVSRSWLDAADGRPLLPIVPAGEPVVTPVAEPVGEPAVVSAEPVREPVRRRVTAKSLTAAERVKAAHEREPDATHERIAEAAECSVATVKRYRPKRAANGSPSGQGAAQTASDTAGPELPEDVPLPGMPERVNGTPVELVEVSR